MLLSYHSKLPTLFLIFDWLNRESVWPIAGPYDPSTFVNPFDSWPTDPWPRLWFTVATDRCRIRPRVAASCDDIHTWLSAGHRRHKMTTSLTVTTIKMTTGFFSASLLPYYAPLVSVHRRRLPWPSKRRNKIKTALWVVRGTRFIYLSSRHSSQLFGRVALISIVASRNERRTDGRTEDDDNFVALFICDIVKFYSVDRAMKQEPPAASVDCRHRLISTTTTGEAWGIASLLDCDNIGTVFSLLYFPAYNFSWCFKSVLQFPALSFSVDFSVLHFQSTHHTWVD